MEVPTELAVQGAGVPQASCHIEVSSVEGGAPPPAPRPVLLVSPGSDSAVKYVLTGPQSAGRGTAAVRSPAAAAAGQATSAARARQILKRRLDLSAAEQKYTKLLQPDLAAGAPPAAAASTPVMICEPEPDAAQKQGRTLFFVAKPPGEAGDKSTAPGQPPPLPEEPAPDADRLPVLRRLARYKLSERYEILPAASLEDAEEIMHRLRLQNLALKTELIRQATEYERHGDEFGLRARRGRKKPTTIVTVDRLRELEKIEVGMHTLFTPSQVKALSRDYKKNSVQWRDEDCRRAIELLEHSSQQTFNYVRKVMNVPLPSLGTLKLRCPQLPELQVRLMEALRERGGEARCRHCSRRAAAAAEAGDGYQPVQPAALQESHLKWTAEPPAPPVGASRKRSRTGAAAARRSVELEDEVVFYEAPAAAAAARGRGRRSGGGGRSAAAGHYQHHFEPPPAGDAAEDDEDEEEEEEEDVFEEEFGEEGEVEVDQLHQEVPAQFTPFRASGEGGWSEWDPRQLH